MTEARPGSTQQFPAPSDDLFIYYIEGRLGPCGRAGENGYIGNWEEDGFSFLFFTKPADEIVRRILATHSDASFIDQYRMTYEEWLGEQFQPFRVGRLFVSPPWTDAETPGGCRRVLLDPGVVFGTGTHPTTRDCLDMLQTVMARDDITTAVDVGTGTGLLALAAARLDCQRVLAYDFNYLSVETARKNISINQLEHAILACQGKAEEMMHISADLLIANIHYDVMKTVIRSEGFLRNRWFILSGLLRSQAREVEYTLSKLPLDILERREHEGVWTTFMVKNRQ